MAEKKLKAILKFMEISVSVALTTEIKVKRIMIKKTTTIDTTKMTTTKKATTKEIMIKETAKKEMTIIWMTEEIIVAGMEINIIIVDRIEIIMMIVIQVGIVVVVVQVEIILDNVERIEAETCMIVTETTMMKEENSIEGDRIMIKETDTISMINMINTTKDRILVTAL